MKKVLLVAIALTFATTILSAQDPNASSYNIGWFLQSSPPTSPSSVPTLSLSIPKAAISCNLTPISGSGSTTPLIVGSGLGVIKFAWDDSANAGKMCETTNDQSAAIQALNFPKCTTSPCPVYQYYGQAVDSTQTPPALSAWVLGVPNFQMPAPPLAVRTLRVIKQ